MTESPTAATPRIRWGWFVSCILLGAAGILFGLLLSPPAERWGYVAGVLGGVGTTLLLVGIVLLLERRIIDTAVRVARDAADHARARSDEVLREQVRDLEGRIADLWASSTETAEDAARKQEQTGRMAEEFTERVVNEYLGEPEQERTDPHRAQR
jgi:hypothetical protein